MSESRLLEGKIAVISGAAPPRGIGMATARMFARQGAKIAILDLDGSAARDAAEGLGGVGVCSRGPVACVLQVLRG